MRKLFSLFSLAICAAATAQPRVSIVGGLQSTSVTPFLKSTQYAAQTQFINELKGSGIRFGFNASLPFKEGGKLFFEPGVIYNARNTTHEQVLDTSLTRMYKITHEQKLNYIDIPLNFVLKLPLKGKTKFILGAGPQASLFYNGKTTVSSLDTLDVYKSESNEDLPVGKDDGKYKVVHVGASALAGFEFGRVYIVANYSKSLTPFYQNVEEYNYTSIGASLGIFLGKAPQVKKPVANPDKDNDGVPNKEDACPEVAGSRLTGGCPDKDGDGIKDAEDSCPDVAGTIRYKGCPIPDKDGDGINDEVDKCIDVAGVAKFNGCPIPDTDKDGINDEEDACPTVAGIKENKGCPEVKKEPVVEKEVVEKVNMAARNIAFEYRKADLTKSSFAVLDEVVKVLKENNELIITVEGHTSGDGLAEHNQKLSQQRADKVKAYFISKGIDPIRIKSIGYGSTRPLKQEINEETRAANRRVEMKLSIK